MNQKERLENLKTTLKIYNMMKDTCDRHLKDYFKKGLTFRTLANAKDSYEFILESLDRDIDNLVLSNKTVEVTSKLDSKYYEVLEKKKEAEQVKKFIQENCLFQNSIMFDHDLYGNINNATVTKIQNYHGYSVRLDVNSAIEAIDDEYFFTFYDQEDDPLQYKGEGLALYYLHLLWYYALREPENKTKITQCIKIYQTLNIVYCIDTLLAELYALSQTNERHLIILKVKAFLDDTRLRKEATDLTSLASMLNYLKMTEAEHVVLNFMKKAKLALSTVANERLVAIENMDQNAPVKQEITQTGFYMDTSSVNWHDKDFEGFFKNLMIQNETLNYHLALRDHNHHLTLNKAVTLPSEGVINNTLNNAFDEEYGDEVKSKIIHGEIVTDGDHTPINGYLVSIDDCPQLGIFLHIMKLGKKLNIKFYTLYMPSNAPASEQKKMALAIYKQTTPAISAWEESVKETILATLQKLLNQSTNNISTTKKDSIIF